MFDLKKALAYHCFVDLAIFFPRQKKPAQKSVDRRSLTLAASKNPISCQRRRSSGMTIVIVTIVIYVKVFYTFQVLVVYWTFQQKNLTIWLFWLPFFFLDTIVMMTIFWNNFLEEYLRTTNFPKGRLSRCPKPWIVGELWWCQGDFNLKLIQTCPEFWMVKLRYFIPTSNWTPNWLDNLAQANRSEDERLPRSISGSIWDVFEAVFSERLGDKLLNQATLPIVTIFSLHCCVSVAPRQLPLQIGHLDE